MDEADIDQLLAYAPAVAETVESEMPELISREHIRARVNRVRELTEDVHFELWISRDKNARTGHKSADSSFFGYKHHLAMTEDGAITAVIVTSGEAADGIQLTSIVEKRHIAGAEFDYIVGDSAYSSRENLVSVASQGCKLVAPLTLREGCYKDGAKSKTYSVSLKSREHSDQLEYEQTDEFKTYRRKRYTIESKNSQLKNTYGLARNKTSDLKGMTLQSVMAIIAVNLKRIISLQKEKTD